MNNPEMNNPELTGELDTQFEDTEVIITLVDPEEKEYEIADQENREKFLKRLEGMREDEVLMIEDAYDSGKEAHRPQRRDSGERYFEHVRSVAIILMDEAGVRDPDLIISALLHDSVEDSALFANRTKAHSDWVKTASYRLSKKFNPRVAKMVITLTKPSVDGVELKTKEEAHHFYIDNLSEADPETIMVKMGDRLHNLRSLTNNTKEKQLKTIKETREVYWPIFKKVLEKYPEAGQHLLGEMEKQMAELEENMEKAE
ncbi:bifunctional (p)ppGpp synthetase/guanosine-3',5'-bis(diphosphate) 3'-pyrophosphohydrolase [bacterium]|nr:MAG: bifunctional (p)ppGpp synthetase/guanosine-3',5'-bis(diphosphate) 3'-pyrophosphohydrolase [bacterium]